MARLNSGPRSEESPMDFKWDDSHGPVQKDSPFLQGTVNLPKYNAFTGHKRPARDLESPTKPSLPALRAPEGQTYLFSSTKPTIRNSSFTTSQRSIETDFSSGPDMSSPVNGDAQDTPEPPTPQSVLPETTSAMVHFAGRQTENAPSHGVFNRHSRSRKGESIWKPHSDAVGWRVEKRRRRDMDRDVRLAPRRASDDEDLEEKLDSSGGKRKDSPSVQPMGIIPSVLTFIDAHPSLPNTLSFYVQFLLNCFFAFCMMYVLYGIYTTIVSDINERAMMESSEIFAEMAACAHEFKENKCERDTRVPAMEAVCNNWEKCMQRDPLKVGRSRLTAGMFAEIFNGFIEPISMKAIVVSLLIIVGCFTVNNLTFGLWRARTHQPPPGSHPIFAHAPPQSPMDWHMQNQGLYTPGQKPEGMGGVGSGQAAYRMEADSPAKRLTFR